MPWKDGYTISDERGIRDADLRWPDNVGAAPIASWSVVSVLMACPGNIECKYRRA